MILIKILKGYAAIGSSLLRLIALISVCLGAAVIVVFPLWKLADSSPELYTAVCLVLGSALVILLSASRIKQSYLRDPRRFILSIIRKATVIAGISFSVALVMHYQRAFAAVVLVVTFLAYGYLAFGLPRDDRKN